MANINANGRQWATIVTYRECHHNHSRRRGRYVVDGCTEFRKAEEDMTLEALICAACNYHTREELSVTMDPATRHLLHQMAAAPSPQAHDPVLGVQFVPVSPPPPPRRGRYVVDGCTEFRNVGEDMTPEALICDPQPTRDELPVAMDPATHNLLHQIAVAPSPQKHVSALGRWQNRGGGRGHDQRRLELGRGGGVGLHLSLTLSMANINANANGRQWATIVTCHECHHNHSRRRGRYIVDGCMEFRKAGEDMTPKALICAACNYHTREELSVAMDPATHHLLHQMAVAPSPQAHVSVLGVNFFSVPEVVPVSSSPPPEENLGDGEVVEDAEVAESRKRTRARSEAIRVEAREWGWQRGRYVVDECTEFRKAGEDMTPKALICAACGCHRNYHRREEIYVAMDPATHHLLHQMAAAPFPQAHVPVLGVSLSLSLRWSPPLHLHHRKKISVMVRWKRIKRRQDRGGGRGLDQSQLEPGRGGVVGKCIGSRWTSVGSTYSTGV
ncbi:hypothetical protein C3L33_20624, partial [Rhododendron williamsianum]